MVAVQYSQDIEEPEDVLDLQDEDAVDFWEKKQRELVTSTVDYNLGTLADLVDERIIGLTPEYQRRFRWDVARQSKLIESFLMNVPVPPIFLNEDKYGQYSVIDGKQRLSAIADFLHGQLRLTGLTVFPDINGRTVRDLPANLQTVIRTRPTLRAVIILRQSDADVKFEVFQRLNTGGVRLNPQEIRNSAYPGPLNDLIQRLSVNDRFHALLGIKHSDRSVIYREMRDAELVLRFFTFRDSWQTLPGSMRRQMDHFMADNQRIDPAALRSLEEDFLKAITLVEVCFGPHAFHRWVPGKQQWRNQVLAALYDAQIFAVRGVDACVARERQATIIERLKSLFEDPDFGNAIDLATNAPGKFRLRIQMVRDLLHEVLSA